MRYMYYHQGYAYGDVFNYIKCCVTFSIDFSSLDVEVMPFMS